MKISDLSTIHNAWLNETKLGKELAEGYTVTPGIDKDRYQARQGLEGPFSTKSGKVVYYDKVEGKYYDPDTDMYIEYDDWQAMNEQGVDEAQEDAFMSGLRGLKSWQVVIRNNYYNGKYSDYSGRYFYVLATSAEEAKQVVLDNADAILQDLLAMKSHNGKKILPRGKAVRITADRIGKIEDGTVAGRMSTANFKKMYSPQGVMMVKLSNGAIADVQGQEQGVAEGSEQVYNILALDKGNALKKPTKLKWKASSLEDIFDALAAQDWYPLEINGVEVVAGKRLKQDVAEGAGNVGNAIKSLYQKIYNAGDDEVEFFYNDSPIFAQYWDEYEGDLDSIIAEVDPKELQIMHDELESYVQQANLDEGYLDNPGEEPSPVVSAITRRILMQRTDLLAKHGPERVGQAIDDVAEWVGDVDEIGSSDVSAWVKQVEQALGQ